MKRVEGKMANRDCWRRIVPFFFFFLVGEKKVLESFEEGFVFSQFLISGNKGRVV